MSIKKIFNKSVILYTLYTALAVVFFVWYLFPSDYFARQIEKSVQAFSKDISIVVTGVKPAFPVGLKMTGVDVTTPAAGSVPVEYIHIGVNPISLIKLDPVITFSAGFFGGTVKGTVNVPERDINKLSVSDIQVKDVDLSECSRFVDPYLPGSTITGSLDASGSYEAAGRGHGKITAVVRQLGLKPEKPLFMIDGLTFSEITAAVELKSKRIQIEKCDIEGEEFDGSVKGSVIIKYPVNRSVLRLSGKFRPEKEFAEKIPLDLVFKKKVKPGDELPFKISGTINKPRFR